MLSDSADLILVAIFLGHFLAKLAKLFPSPLKLMIPVTQLLGGVGKVNVELLVRSCHHHYRRSKVAPNTVDSSIHILDSQMLDHFDHTYHLEVSLPKSAVTT